MTNQEYKKGFGTMAIDLGYITKEQLIEAMEIQIKENLETRNHRHIGTILKDLGHMDLRKIEKILKEMGR